MWFNIKTKHTSPILDKKWYKNGQLSYDKQNNIHFDKDGNEIDSNEWAKIKRKDTWGEDN